ncbi:Gfo/Idh/MocA family oxidoreductase [Alteromonas ponticola]|uniref:Gfo/Idh/MocA family oxidoreductase n=1 Tax=Alteromonas aquimaris TaxID=2998417 RepID=A0ABT3P8G7_9ALTE|nr:Gfo/Idh/MocA family oxidoreductase [Alteromonas aquimaris]MCW8109073.1 Gfo/Idh/MocA family oxidoreductase [Alteromonas aquimaris]
MPQLTRRQFLASGLAALAMPHFRLLGARTPSSPRKLGVALLGLGGYSKGLLAPALQHTQFCELRGIVTGSPEKIPQWQKQYNIADKNVYSYDDLPNIANNSDIDIIYVVTPTSLHEKYSVIAAQAGKHVWCEKPMAMNPRECQNIMDTCKQNKVKLAIGYRMQHEPNTRRLASLKNTMPFGAFTRIASFAGYAGNGLPANNWRMQKEMGGGALYDMGVYPINGVRFITGMEPVSVTGYHEKSHPDTFTEVDETTYFDMQFKNGLVAQCGTSVVKSFNRLEVQCERGVYSLQPMQSYSGVRGKISDGTVLSPITGMQQTLQMDNDALAILGKGPALVSGEEGLKDIQIIQAIFDSAKTGKTVVI